MPNQARLRLTNQSHPEAIDAQERHADICPNPSTDNNDGQILQTLTNLDSIKPSSGRKTSGRQRMRRKQWKHLQLRRGQIDQEY
jgi:hypothetical protein